MGNTTFSNDAALPYSAMEWDLAKKYSKPLCDRFARFLGMEGYNPNRPHRREVPELNPPRRPHWEGLMAVGAVQGALAQGMAGREGFGD